MKEIKETPMEKKKTLKVDITRHDTELISTAGAKRVKGTNPRPIGSHYLCRVADDSYPSSGSRCPEA